MSDNFKVVMVTGMRQTGKTTLLKSLSGGSRAYVTMDDARTLKLAKDDPYLFFETHRPPLFIDEIQYAPELFSHIKMISSVWNI
jgi:predicted AAA+ superfamily ATPase